MDRWVFRPKVVLLEVRLEDLEHPPYDPAQRALEKLPGSCYTDLLYTGPACWGINLPMA